MANVPISKMQVPGSEDTLLLRDSTAANKVQSATNGDLAGLDSNGNLTDSGVRASSIGNLSGSHLGTCETAASTSVKIVTIGDGTWIPKEGDIIGVKFTYSNTALFVTLNVNGIGNKNIWYGDSVDPSGADYICGKADSYIFYMYDGTYWIWLNEGQHDGNTLPSVAVYTVSNQQIKIGTCNYYTLTNKSYCHFIFRYPNSYKGELFIKINNSSSKTIYINGEISSSTNYTLPAGTYIAYYENDKWYFRTDGILPAKTTEGAEINERLDTTTTSASGNPISITGLKSNQLAVNPIITLEPIQDLHGQSKPYPAGGGKNKLVYTVESIKAANTSGTWSGNVYTLNGVTFTINTDSANNVTGIKVNGTASGQTNFFMTNSLSLANGNYTVSGCPANGSTATYLISITSNPAGSNKTETGNGATFEVTSSLSYTALRIVVQNTASVSNLVFYPQIESGSSKTTFAPSSNYAPISGYDKIEVLSCGKNLWDDGDVTPNSMSQSGNTYTNTNTDTRTSVYLRVQLLNGATVVRSVSIQEGISTVGRYSKTISVESGEKVTDIRLTHNGASRNIGATYNLPIPITTPCTLMVSANITATNPSVVGSFVMKDIQVELGSSVSTYQAYHKTTDLSENLPQTVYGGSLDVEKGKVSVKKNIILPDNDWTYSTFGGKNYIYKTLSDIYSATPRIDPISEMCKFGGYGGAAIFEDGKLYQTEDGKTLYIQDSRFLTKEAFLSEYGNCKICYELATPIEIQLTPHEISLLKDYAYVSTNGTSISLDYHNGEIATLGDVSQLGETINELGNYISKNESGERTDITSYTSADRFKIPCDGYVVISSETSTSGKIYLVVGGQSTGNIAFLYMHVAGTYQMQSLFVKKGLRCYLSEKTATAGKAWFYPLV